MRTIVLWAERLGASLLVLLFLAILAPDLIEPRVGFHGWVFVTYAAIACLLVACIVVGQARSLGLRIVGWVLLVTLCVLEARVL